MRRQVAILALTLLLTGGVTLDVQAAGPFGRLLRRSSPAQQAPVPGYQLRTPYRYSYPTAEELYPKYYGSFHYRHLDNIGIPTGDIGIRGNGLYMYPW